MFFFFKHNSLFFFFLMNIHSGGIARFPYLEPPRDNLRLIPFFLPFAGCPRRCVFCDQHAQTGVARVDLDVAVADLRARLKAARIPFGLGFFGGTFTGVAREWQLRFLGVAADFRTRGLRHVRISTRPDRLDPETADWLQAHGVDMVELGVQTFQPDVLRVSGRGHGPEVSDRACRLIHEAGIDLGIQLLPGLPGHDARMWREDVHATIARKPAVVRIYPCVVMAETALARMHSLGEYTPWPLDLTVREVGWAVRRFWAAGIRVIRLGVANEAEMRAKLVAGPWHPAFGSMVRSEVLCRFLEDLLVGRRLRVLYLPERLQGEVWGHGRANASRLGRLGISKETLRTWSASDIGVDMEE